MGGGVWTCNGRYWKIIKRQSPVQMQVDANCCDPARFATIGRLNIFAPICTIPHWDELNIGMSQHPLCPGQLPEQRASMIFNGTDFPSRQLCLNVIKSEPGHCITFPINHTALACVSRMGHRISNKKNPCSSTRHWQQLKRGGD